MTTHLRPRFQISLDLEVEKVVEVFTKEKNRDDKSCSLQIFDDQIELRIRQEDRHFWSPFLRLSIIEESGVVMLRGKHGPNANVWTMFTALYAAISIVGVMALIFGMSQLRLGQSFTGFLVAGICALALFIVHLAGHWGRRKAHPQMLTFHTCLETLFDEHILSFEDENKDT